jgi:hypothetical protein
LIPSINFNDWRQCAELRLLAARARQGDFQANDELNRWRERVEALKMEYHHQSALTTLGIVLLRAGRVEDARELESSVVVDNTFYWELAAAHARAGKFDQALLELGEWRAGEDRQLNGYVQAIAEWSPAYEAAFPESTTAVLQAALKVAGWISLEWEEISKLISRASSAEPAPVR